VSLKSLLHGITAFETQINQRQQHKRTVRLARGKEEPAAEAQPLGHHGFGDVHLWFAQVLASARQDSQRLVPPAPPLLDPTAPAPAPPPQPPISRFMATLFGQWNDFSAPAPVRLPEADALPALPASPQQVIADIFQTELASLQDPAMLAPGRPPLSSTLINKLRQAEQAFLTDRAKDTITILRNALTGDPHNHLVLHLMSQVLYYLTHNGQQGALPEARDMAQRSCIQSDRLTPEKLALYRYRAITTEWAFGPERTIEWLRDHELLNPARLCGPHGLLAEQGQALKAWAILSTIPPALWSPHEFNALHDVINRAVGGGAMYLAWFQKPLETAQNQSKMPLPQYANITQLMHNVQVAYGEAAPALRSLPLTSSPHPWILRVQFLHTLVQVAGHPTLPQVLCHINLAGDQWERHTFPTTEVQRSIKDNDIDYWQLWCLFLTPHKNLRQPFLLPAEETAQDGDLLAAADQLLEQLRKLEQSMLMPQHESLRAWLPKWQLEHILAAGTGSNKPRLRFAPGLSPYANFYRRWQKPEIQHWLPSEIIAGTAARGAFASLFEIQAAFLGAARLIHDADNGLAALQKRAMALARRQNPSKFGKMAEPGSGLSLQGLSSLIVPLGGLGAAAAVINLSANLGQALGLLLALAGVIGVLFLMRKK
jgi:hypothetical protein